MPYLPTGNGSGILEEFFTGFDPKNMIEVILVVMIVRHGHEIRGPCFGMSLPSECLLGGVPTSRISGKFRTSHHQITLRLPWKYIVTVTTYHSRGS